MEELKTKCEEMAADLAAALELCDNAKAKSEMKAIELRHDIVKAEKVLKRIAGTIDTFFAG